MATLARSETAPEQRERLFFLLMALAIAATVAAAFSLFLAAVCLGVALGVGTSGASSSLGTEICGEISADATWTLDGSPYDVTCDTVLQPGFTLTIEGRSAHGARPHEGTDAVVLAARTVVALQTIISRGVDPSQSAVVTIGKISGGLRANIIAPGVTTFVCFGNCECLP